MKIDVLWRTAPCIPVYVHQNVGRWRYYTVTWQKTVIFRCKLSYSWTNFFEILYSELDCKNSCNHELHMFFYCRFFCRVIRNLNFYFNLRITHCALWNAECFLMRAFALLSVFCLVTFFEKKKEEKYSTTCFCRSWRYHSSNYEEIYPLLYNTF
jgi:hypothetical protein